MRLFICFFFIHWYQSQTAYYW